MYTTSGGGSALSANVRHTLPPTTLVLGGARSGKSRYAERLVGDHLTRTGGGPAVYVATAAAGDAEMAARIAAHRARRDARWHTVEAPLDLAGAIMATAADAPGTDAPVLVDCLTLWLTNVMLADRDPEAATETLIAALRDMAAPTVLVANEVGLGIVPDSALGRRFRDAAGRLNQAVAAIADQVIFVAAGLPLILKAVEHTE